MVSSIFFTDEINVYMIVSVSWYEKWSQKRTSSMELQIIRTRLSFLLHYNKCIKLENLEIFGNGKLTFHCHFFPLQLNCWSCWCLRYQSLFPSRSNWNGNFQNWVIIPKIQPKKGKKSGINMGAGGVEIAILKLGHSSSNSFTSSGWNVMANIFSLKRTYKSAAPPLTTCIFLNWHPQWK